MPAGRPLKYKTPAEMQKAIDLYFLAIKAKTDPEILTGESDKTILAVNDIEDTVPTVSGLAYTLGMSTEALRNYEAKEQFLATVKRAKQRIEISLETRLAGNNVTGAIFNLKNNFNWKDKTEQEHSGEISIIGLKKDFGDG